MRLAGEDRYAAASASTAAMGPSGYAGREGREPVPQSAKRRHLPIDDAGYVETDSIVAQNLGAHVSCYAEPTQVSVAPFV